MAKKKHPKDMTSEELAKHVFHPKVLKAAKAHVERLNTPKEPRKSVK
ncbi:MAG: hypothetical protein WCC22_04405 [Terriglobales bacterium]